MFTYEAIPLQRRFLVPRTAYLDSQFFTINGQPPAPQINGQATTVQNVAQQRVLAQFEHLGIGGMNTRGMGRLRIFLPEQGR